MKKKFYVVWKGRKTGIFESWDECEKQIKGFQDAKYKSFDNIHLAKTAFFNQPEEHFQKKIKTPIHSQALKNPPILESITVDGAHSFSTHLSEYQGVYTKTGEKIFHNGPFQSGSNNLMEFLAIVHALALCKQKNWNVPIYSDSKTAISWVKQKKVNTNIQKTFENQEVFELVHRALQWLEKNHYENLILKWDTENWGENPADFGRK